MPSMRQQPPRCPDRNGRPDERCGPIVVIHDHPVGSPGDIDTLVDQIRTELQKAISGGQVKVDVQIRASRPRTWGRSDASQESP